MNELSALLLEHLNNTSGEIFKIMDDELRKRNILWKNYVPFGCDNANIMIFQNKCYFFYIKNNVQPNDHF